MNTAQFKVLTMWDLKEEFANRAKNYRSCPIHQANPLITVGGFKLLCCGTGHKCKNKELRYLVNRLSSAEVKLNELRSKRKLKNYKDISLQEVKHHKQEPLFVLPPIVNIINITIQQYDNIDELFNANAKQLLLQNSLSSENFISSIISMFFNAPPSDGRKTALSMALSEDPTKRNSFKRIIGKKLQAINHSKQ